MIRYSLIWVLGIVLYTALPQGVLALVNINTATLDELDTLPYVGTSTAQAIISGRPYSATSDIQRVSGFGGGAGTRNYDSIIGLITVDGETSVPVESTVTNSSASKTVSEAKKSTTPGPITGLTLTMPERAYAGQLLSFDVNPNDGNTGRFARYKWNFGDGTIDDFKKPTHRYANPGTYVVMVESYYQKETKLARKEIEVLPLALRIEKVSSSEVRVINNGSHEIDLGSMVLVGNGQFTFPKYTILLPDQSLIVKVDNAGSVVLKDGEGVVLVAGPTDVSPSQSASVSVKQVATKAPTILEATSTGESSSNEVSSISSNQVAALPAADVPQEAWPYLALFAVVGLGIFAIYGTKSTG